VIEQIKTAVHQAAAQNQKIAMFDYQILTNAKALEGLKVETFCRDVGVPLSYHIEFRKMMALAKLLEELGAKVVIE
jgi:hypothetical protein